MKRKAPHIPILLLGSLLLATPLASRAGDSLYDAGHAEYLKGGNLFDFGPKSKNIRYDKRMIEAAEIAALRAHAHSTSRCWAYVKNALLAANLVSSRPTSGY